MLARPLVNGAVGPLDELVAFGLPILVLVGLWWWSSRAERRRAAKDDETEEQRPERRD